MSDHLFNLALGLTRAEAAPTLSKLATKHQFLRKLKTPYDFSTTICFEADGVEHEIEVGICYDATWEPARLHGAWEDCYPDSSEMDIHDLIILDALPEGVTDGMVWIAAEYARDRIESEAWEHFDQQQDEDQYHD